MMLLLLLCLLPGILLADLPTYPLEVEEGAATYTQTVTFDFENQVQTIEVPAHHNIVHTRAFFDFTQVSSMGQYYVLL